MESMMKQSYNVTPQQVVLGSSETRIAGTSSDVSRAGSGTNRTIQDHQFQCYCKHCSIKRAVKVIPKAGRSERIQRPVSTPKCPVPL
jgi:hypothetical protein